MNIDDERHYNQQLGRALDLDTGLRAQYLEQIHAAEPEVALRLAGDLALVEHGAGDFERKLNYLIGDEVQALFGAANEGPLDQRTNLGFYQILGILGRGGMGVVYHARDTRLVRDVALKVLNGKLAHDPLCVSRFQREGRAAANLNHPHIVSVYSIEVCDSFHLLTMELVQGQSLATALQSGPLSPQSFLEVARALADALAYAHDHGVIHRDVNPANIMLGPLVKILDFGLARLDSQHPGSSESGLSKPGSIMGTVSYMAPEQLTGGPIDQRTDLFALGVTFFEMLVGQRPFDRASQAETMTAILRDGPHPDPLMLPLPLELCRMLNSCLARDPQDRPSQAKDILAVLKRLNPTDFRPARFQVSRRNFLLAASLPFLAGSLWWALHSSPSFQPLEPSGNGCRILLRPFPAMPDDNGFSEVAGYLLKQKLELFDRFKVHEQDELRAGLPVMGIAEDSPWSDTLLAAACKLQGIPYLLRGELKREAGKHLLTLELSKPGTQKAFSSQVYEDIGGLRDAIDHLGDAIKQELRPSDSQPGKTLRDVSSTDPRVLEAFAKALQASAPVQAEIHLREALRIDPDFAPALRALGVALSSLELRGQGLVASIRARELAQRFSVREQILDEANLEMQLKHYSRADLEFTRYLTNYLPDEYVLRQRAHCASARCMLDEAVVHMEQAVTVPPIKALNHGMLVIALAEAGRPEVLKTARRARTYFPNDIYLHWAEGDALALSGRLTDARESYRRLKDDPGMAPYSPLLMGRLGLIDGDFDRAIQDLGKVTNERPGIWHESKIYLARLNLLRQRPEDARDHLIDLASLESVRTNVTHLRKLVFLWAELKEPKRAELDLAKLQIALGDEPGSWLQGTWRSAAGAVAFANGDLEGAALHLGEAINNRRDIPALWWMARCRMAQAQRWETALELLDEIRAAKGMAFRNGDADLWVLADREAALCLDQLGQNQAAQKRRLRLSRQWRQWPSSPKGA